MDGGNAIDAAVAAAATLGVVEPESTGLGGDMFAIVWSARDKKLYGVEASGWAPQGWTPEYFRETLGVDEVPNDGINSAVVPGSVSGWDALLKRFGSMDFKKVLEPARAYAEEGFPVHERVAGDWQGAEEALAEDPDSASTFLPGGKAPEMYSTFRNPDLAKALRLIQRGRPRCVLQGPDRAGDRREVPGGRRRDDHERPGRVSEGAVHDAAVDELPRLRRPSAAASGSGLRGARDAEHPRGVRSRARRQPRRAGAEGSSVLPPDDRGEEARLLGPPPLQRRPGVRGRRRPTGCCPRSYAATLCDEIDMDHARPADVLGNDQGSTVYFTVADRWGNMVSFVNSIFSGFGSKVTVPGYGFPLANRGAGFTLEEGHPNEVAPRKRPFITIIASFITKDGKPVMAFGNMGGGTQPQAHVQHVVNMVDLGMNVQATTDVARFDHSQESDIDRVGYVPLRPRRPGLGRRGDTRSRVREVTPAAIRASCSSPTRACRSREVPRGKGCCKGALEPGHRDAYERPLNGVYRAGSDPRKDGHAGGW